MKQIKQNLFGGWESDLNRFKQEPIRFVINLWTRIDETLSWNTHADCVIKKLLQANDIISKLHYLCTSENSPSNLLCTFSI